MASKLYPILAGNLSSVSLFYHWTNQIEFSIFLSFIIPFIIFIILFIYLLINLLYFIIFLSFLFFFFWTYSNYKNYAKITETLFYKFWYLMCLVTPSKLTRIRRFGQNGSTKGKSIMELNFHSKNLYISNVACSSVLLLKIIKTILGSYSLRRIHRS